MAQTATPREDVGGLQSHAPQRTKNERDNGVAPANAYANSSNTNTATDALNNLAAATAEDRQAAANQAEAVVNVTVSNQNIAQQLQLSQQ